MSDPSSPNDLPNRTRPRDGVDVSNEDEADFEYEVEPADAEVTANQQALARSELKQAEAAIDVDAIYREMDNRDTFDAALEGFKARFSIRTLLIATAAVAVVLGFGGSGLIGGGSFAVFICVSLVGLGSAHAWLNYKENQRREALIARRERELKLSRGETIDDEEEARDAKGSLGGTDGTPATLIGWLRTMTQFSALELLIAMGVASLMLVLMKVAGSPMGAAAAMGSLAIMGFAMQAGEMNIPRPAILAWWLALFGYCLLTVASVVFGIG